MNRTTRDLSILAAGLLLYALSLCSPFPCLLPSLSAATVQSQTDQALTVWPHEKSDLESDPTIHYGRLDNGLRYIIMPNQEPKHRVSMHLNIQIGSMNETDPERGMAHFLEHMLFNGSRHFPPGELVKFFQSIGMQFGADANAHTGFYETVYDVLLPDGDAENLKKGLLVFLDYAEGALLLEDEVNRETDVVLAEKRTRDSADYRTHVAAMKFEFPNARLSQRMPIGTEETIRSVTQKGLKHFYDTWYQPGNMTIVMVGDLKAATAEKLVQEMFSPLKPRAAEKPEPPFGEIKHTGIKPFYHYEKETGNTTVSIGYVKKILAEPDSFELEKRLLIEHLGFQILQNRLDSLVRKPDTPFTNAYASTGIVFRQVRYTDLTAECSPEKWEATLALLEKTLRTAISYEFTQSELDRAKKDYLAALDKAVQSAKTRTSQSLASHLIYSLNNDRVFQSPQEKQRLFAPVVESLPLSAVHQAFQRIWAEDARLISVTGNAQLSAPAEAKIRDIYTQSSLTAVSRPRDEKPTVFPYLPDPDKTGTIYARHKYPGLGITSIDFQNNIRLNLKQTDFKANEIILTLSFGKGRYSEPASRPGLAVLGTAVINAGGLGQLKKDDLEKALAGKNTNVYLDIKEDRFNLVGRSVTREARLLFQLLYAYITDMGFHEDAFQLTQERFFQMYHQMAQDTDGGMALYGKRYLAGGDPRFGFPSLEELRQISLNDIRTWIQEQLKRGTFEVSVVGDFDPKQIIELAGQYLGTLPPRQGKPSAASTAGPIRFPAGKSHTIEVPTKIRKGILTVAYPTDDFWDITKTRRLSVLGEVFSERMRVRIREQMGASYTTYAYNQPSRAFKGYGVFHAVAQIDPDRHLQVQAKIKEIADNLRANGITADEFKRALDPIITSIKDLQRTNRYWLNSVLDGSRNAPQQLNWSRTLLADYQSITKEEIRQLAEQYLDNTNAAVLEIRPGDRP